MRISDWSSDVCSSDLAEQWQVDSLHEEVLRLFNLDLPLKDWAKEESIADQEIKERIAAAVKQRMAAKTANFGPEVMRGLEKQILLLVLDRQWKDHLLSLDHLRQRSEEHTSELQSLMRISYAVFCLQKKHRLTR